MPTPTCKLLAASNVLAHQKKLADLINDLASAQGETMSDYCVKFERIGRSKDVPDLKTSAENADELAANIYKYARKHLRSRDVEVEVDLDEGTGFIACGMHSGGTFTIQRQGD